MKLMHNPEIRTFVLVCGSLTVLLTLLLSFLNRICALLFLLAGIVFLLFFLIFEKKRYQRIQSLSDELDAVLNKNKDFLISDMKEGDLSILQNEIAKTTQQLRTQRDHLRDDRQFMARTMADISHQLRTPLTSIRLNLTLLKDPSLSESRRKEILREISASVSRMERLIEELLKLSRLDAGAAVMKRVPVPVRQIIHQSLDALAIPLDLRDIRIVQNIEENAVVNADMYWTSEAFTNIIKNCMEHVQEGGTITITAEDTALFTSVIIRDNGEGFSEEDLPHVFERFYRGKNASPSSIGIGLALAQTIIHDQDGTIRASNHPEGGACFTIRFYKQVI